MPEGREWIAGLPDELSGQRKIMLSLLDWSEADERVGWLVVACSVGRGNADRLSDLDMGLAIDVPEADFDAAVADVHQAVDQAGDLIESYHHKLPGVPFTHERIFAQYADRCQVDLVVIPLAQDYGPVKDEVKAQLIKAKAPADEIQKFLDQMPNRYFFTLPEGDVLLHFDMMRALGESPLP